MGFNAHVLRVLIASPGDVQAERDAIVQTILRWDASRAAGAGLLFLPRRWEIDSVPQLTGTDGQAIINEQLVKDVDVVIAVFHSRLGAATPRAASGTAEELQHARDAGKPVHVYFSRAGLPADVDPEQLASLREFKKSLYDLGLVGEYDDIGDLQQQVASALELDASFFSDAALGDEVARPRRHQARGARLRAEYAEDRELRTGANGSQSTHTSNTRVTVTNHGDATAESVRLIANETEAGATIMFFTQVQPNIIDGASYSFPAMVRLYGDDLVEVTILWKEDGEEKSITQSISPH